MADGINPQVRPFYSCTDAFSNGSDTPRDLLERCIDVIENHEKTIGAFVVTNLEGARAAADQSTTRWREGKEFSRIDGMPVGIKDVMETSQENLGNLKVSKDEIIENVAEKILTQEKAVAVIDENNKIIGSINPSKIINTVFGGRKNNN